MISESSLLLGSDMNKSQTKLFLKFLKYLLPYRKKQIIVLILNVAAILLALLNPYIGKLVVDDAFVNKDLKKFILLGLIGAVVFISNGFIKAIANFLSRNIFLRVQFDLNKRVFNNLGGFPLSFFRDKSTGELSFKISYDIERTANFIVSIPEELVAVFPRLFFILVIIFYLDWQMAIFSLGFLPIVYFPIRYLTGRIRKILEELLGNSEGIFIRLQEVFSHIYLVKALGKEKAEIRKYLKALLDNMKISLKNTRLEIASGLATSSLHRLIIGLITLFGGFQVIRGRITLGTFTAIMIYISQLVDLQNSAAFFFQRIVLGLVSCRRIDEILNEKAKLQITDNARRAIFKEPRIQFKRISFGYNPDKQILKNLEFSIEKGIVALVGASGCGKTTILNLILRLYEPQEGQIFIDGHNITDIDVFSMREQIGVALQEPFLWNDSIENNIRYAMNNGGSKEGVLEIARLFGVDDFVKTLPKGYDTRIGESACKLSEGQKQKIALVRAVIKRPKILILDEAMSSMDSQSEEKIVAQIRRIDKIYTTIIVSHRLSTALACDLVYFLKEANEPIIVERPQTLIKKDELFCNLFAAQTKELAVETIV